MARSKKSFKPMRSKRSGIKTLQRIKQNNEILKKMAKELNDNSKIKKP